MHSQVAEVVGLRYGSATLVQPLCDREVSVAARPVHGRLTAIADLGVHIRRREAAFHHPSKVQLVLRIKKLIDGLHCLPTERRVQRTDNARAAARDYSTRISDPLRAVYAVRSAMLMLLARPAAVLSDWRPYRVPTDTRTALSQAHQRFRSLKDHFQRALVMLYKSLSKNIFHGS